MTQGDGQGRGETAERHGTQGRDRRGMTRRWAWRGGGRGVGAWHGRAWRRACQATLLLWQSFWAERRPGLLVSSAATQPGGRKSPCSPRSPRGVPGPAPSWRLETSDLPEEKSLLAVSWGLLWLGGAEGQPVLALGPPAPSVVAAGCRPQQEPCKVKLSSFWELIWSRWALSPKVPCPAWVSWDLVLSLVMPMEQLPLLAVQGDPAQGPSPSCAQRGGRQEMPFGAGGLPQGDPGCPPWRSPSIPWPGTCGHTCCPS